MALLERVTTLLRANVNDLLDKAEDPPVMLKQLLRDMENQLLQVKTQVAAAVADQHVLQARCAEFDESVKAWRRKAELALQKSDEALARVAAERCLQAEQTLDGYQQQLLDQRSEADWMRERYRELEAKLAETRAQGELLLAAHRRATRRDASGATPEQARLVLQRMRDAALSAEAAKTAGRQTEMQLGGSAEGRLQQMEKQARIDALLEELRGNTHLLPRQT